MLAGRLSRIAAGRVVVRGTPTERKHSSLPRSNDTPKWFQGVALSPKRWPRGRIEEMKNGMATHKNVAIEQTRNHFLTRPGLRLIPNLSAESAAISTTTNGRQFR